MDVTSHSADGVDMKNYKLGQFALVCGSILLTACSSMFVDEEGSRDFETTHANETIGFGVFEAGALSGVRTGDAALVTQAELDAIAPRLHIIITLIRRRIFRSKTLIIEEAPLWFFLHPQ